MSRSTRSSRKSKGSRPIPFHPRVLQGLLRPDPPTTAFAILSASLTTSSKASFQLRNRADLTDLMDQLLNRVTMPGQYVGGEWNSRRRDPKSARMRIVVASPSPYGLGLNEPTFRTVFDLLARRADVSVERAFLPQSDMEAELRAANLPLGSLESRTPLSDFDLVVLPLSDEVAYAGVPGILELGGIAPLERDRSTAVGATRHESPKEAPLVLAVGPCTRNPEPIADFLDAVLPGELEAGLDPLLDQLIALLGRGARTERLHELARTLGTVYVPAFYEPAPAGSASGGSTPVPLRSDLPGAIVMPWVQDLDRAPAPTAPHVAFVQTANEEITIELQRGGEIDVDTDAAPDTAAGVEAPPPLRRRSLDRVIDLAEQTYRATGFDRIRLAGSQRARYPELVPLIDRLAERFAPRRVEIGLDPLPVAAWVRSAIRSLARTHRPTVALDVLAGSERLRDVIGRAATNRDVLDLVQEAVQRGLLHVDLRFRIGWPEESDDDLESLVGLARDCFALCKSAPDSPTRIHVHVEAFRPMPFTAWESESSPGADELARRMAVIRERAASEAKRFTFEDPVRAELRLALARGDRSYGPRIFRAWSAGARIESETDPIDRDAWGMSAEPAAGETQADRAAEGRALPWSHFSWARPDRSSASDMKTGGTPADVSGL